VGQPTWVSGFPRARRKVGVGTWVPVTDTGAGARAGRRRRVAYGHESHADVRPLGVLIVYRVDITVYS
jgi:hypothetical protein